MIEKLRLCGSRAILAEQKHRIVSEVCGMSASVVGIEKPVIIDRKQNLREHRLYWVGRRTQDVVLSALALVVLSPVMLATAIAIVVDDPSAGPIFSQERIGRDGKPFKFYKFRSMYVDAEERKKELMAQNEVQGLMFKMENDPRITKVGRFIRKTSIDELPQFWNILKGDMSLVGTRPPTVDEFERYEAKHKCRLSMTPGLTGLWQVSGRSDIKDFDEVVQLDMQYIDNWSILKDIKILLLTVGIVITGKGSR